MDISDPAALVSRAPADRLDRLADRRLVAHRTPTPADPLGAHPAPREPQGQFATQALLSRHRFGRHPLALRSWFVLRWQREVTCQAVRAHLGVETQRHWSQRELARTTPTLLGLFSFVALLAHEPMTRHSTPAQQTAWYTQATPTFSDALALVRQHLWTQTTFPTSPGTGEVENVPRALLDHLADLLCYAA